MWIVGTLILFAIAIASVVAIGWAPRAEASPPLWDIPSLGQTYTGIVGTLGGFTVASAIFIASLDSARRSPAYATVIGMLLVAFLILVFAALLYASAPQAWDADDLAHQAMSHLLANMGGCLGLSTSWLALVPLLELVELPALAETFTWLLLTVALGGAAWTALFAFRLTTARAAACLAIPIIGFGLPALYRLVVVPLWPALWPATDPALQFVFFSLAVAGLMFALQSILLLTHGDKRVQQRLRRDGHWVILAYSEAAVLAVGLLWFAVALP
jgi:hypothetical protein